MKKTRDYYDRRLIEMMDCKPESLAARQGAAFDCFVELMRENRFPDLRLQFHALFRVLQDLLRSAEGALSPVSPAGWARTLNLNH
jgi:hypothetical protein